MSVQLPERARVYLPTFEQLGAEFKLHPFLLAAIVDQETLCGTSPLLHPKGPSGTGDWARDPATGRRTGTYGHGRGIWQVDDRAHAAFCARRLPDGRWAWEDPLEGGRYAMAEVLVPALKALDGDVSLALSAYNCGVGNVRKVLAKLPLAAPFARRRSVDAITAHGTYAQAVMFRLACFTAGRDPELAGVR